MSSNAVKALQCETEFLSGVAANFEAAKGKLFRGTIWQSTRQEDIDRLKGMMAEHRNYDRELLKSLPANRRIILQGFERGWLWGRRPTGVAVASVLVPLRHFASSAAGSAPPIDLGDLVDHVRQVVGGNKASHVIGVCSPSGFTEEARSARLGMPNVTVVLIEPDGHGGWRTISTGEPLDPRIRKLFDPEGTKQKFDRVSRLLEERSADLLTGGLTASAVAEELGLPEDIVRQAFERAVSVDGELKSAMRDGEFLLFRGAPAMPQERKAMGVIDRIKQLFSNEGRESEKINLLAERRAALARRRDRIYEDIGKLEQREADLLAQGKATKSEVPRRRLAAQLAQMRKDIARQNTTAAMLNQQINIISTDIHNLTLIQQGQLADLPQTEELTENAVKAEEMLETLKADAELVGGLTTGLSELTTSDEELAILREFEGEEPATEPWSHEATKDKARSASDRLAASHEATPASRLAGPRSPEGNPSPERLRSGPNQYRDREGAGPPDSERPSKGRSGDAEAV